MTVIILYVKKPDIVKTVTEIKMYQSGYTTAT